MRWQGRLTSRQQAPLWKGSGTQARREGIGGVGRQFAEAQIARQLDAASSGLPLGGGRKKAGPKAGDSASYRGRANVNGFIYPLASKPGDDLLFHCLSNSIIGAVRFHGRVRDGIGWVTDAMVTKLWSRRITPQSDGGVISILRGRMHAAILWGPRIRGPRSRNRAHWLSC